MKAFVVVVAFSVMLAASPAFAQAPAGAQAPAKPATAPPAVPAQAAPAPAAPKPFPQGAKVAYVVLQRIANESADGRVATTRIQALQQKKAAELNEKNKQLTSAQQKLEKEGAVMSPAAAELQKTVERLNVEVQRFTQDAQAEVQELQQTLQQEFQQRLEPVLQQVATDMGLQFVFNGPDAGLVWADASLDISAEVIKKLDSAKPAGAKPPAPTKPPGQ
jgi:outer membrane protein